MMLSEEAIRRIRDSLNIRDVIMAHVTLKAEGNSYVGRCPFKSHSRPLFCVSPHKQFYYCFGCARSGDCFRFLMDLQKRSFADVARELAAKARVELPSEGATEVRHVS